MTPAGGPDPRAVAAINLRPVLAYAKAQIQSALDQDPDRIILRPEDARLVFKLITGVEIALDVADERDRLAAALAASESRAAGAEASEQATADAFVKVADVVGVQAGKLLWLDVKQALANARARAEAAERVHQWHDRQWALSRQGWVKAARAALNGDLSELRSRVAMYDAGPVEMLDGEDQLADRVIDPEAAARALRRKSRT